MTEFVVPTVGRLLFTQPMINLVDVAVDGVANASAVAITNPRAHPLAPQSKIMRQIRTAFSAHANGADESWS